MNRYALRSDIRFSMNQSDVQFAGHAIECRVTAENPMNNFMPTPGRITRFAVPYGDRIRVDTHCHQGYKISPFYDSLMAKVIATGENRDIALVNLKKALSAFEIEGVKSNIPFLQFLINRPEFAEGKINVKWIEDTVLPEFLNPQTKESINYGIWLKTVLCEVQRSIKPFAWAVGT